MSQIIVENVQHTYRPPRGRSVLALDDVSLTARTLAFDPAILLMDEPFGALDAQTRSLMQDELLGIWQRTPKTVIFVTHDVTEAVHLADRVAVMSARPGRIKTIVETGFDRGERNVFKSKAFVDKVDEIWNLVRDEA